MITYWLWWGDRILTSVRAAPGLSDSEVKWLAIDSNNRVPICQPDFAPFEFNSYVARATVKVYPDGN